MSLVPADLKKEPGLHSEAQPADIAAGQGNSKANEGVLKVNLKFGRRKTLQFFVVTRDVDLPTPILLDSNFMFQHNIVLKNAEAN